MMRPRHTCRHGFSLIELLAGVVIVMLLASLSAAGFAPVLDRFRLSVASGDFREALAVARNEAIRRGQRVDLLPAVAGNWSAGWIVVIDANNNQMADAGELVLRQRERPDSRVSVSAALRDGSRAYLAFDPSGRPRSAESAMLPQFGSLTFRAGDQRRKVIINFLGRARLCDPDRDPAAC